jgi:hypothetical protein
MLQLLPLTNMTPSRYERFWAYQPLLPRGTQEKELPRVPDVRGRALDIQFPSRAG